MRKSTNSSKRKRKAAIKRRQNRLKFLCKELARATEQPRRNELAADRISQLPDDILISIISRLTLREATTTSVISTRWRHLHTYINHLRFPPFRHKKIVFYLYLLKKQEEKFSNYLDSIDQTLDSYKGSGALKEFRVSMHCFEGANIERWFEFALARQVEIINIEMIRMPNIADGSYTLGLSNMIKNNKSLSGLKSLKEISLYGVHVDDEEAELLLSEFPLLESLSIAHSTRLEKISIVGHSALKLKHLNVSYADNLQSITIDGMIKLVSLRCYKLPSQYGLRLRNVPKLVEFSTSEEYDNTIVKILSKISPRVRDRLRVFKLSTYISFTKPLLKYELIKIKHLELEIRMYTHSFPDRFYPLIEACRSLEKLEIKFLWWRKKTKEFLTDKEVFVDSPTKPLSPNLKKLILSGYLGCTAELELALFVMKNVAAFQELIVEPCDVSRKIRRASTRRAWKQFRPTTPPSVNLIII